MSGTHRVRVISAAGESGDSAAILVRKIQEDHNSKHYNWKFGPWGIRDGVVVSRGTVNWRTPDGGRKSLVELRIGTLEGDIVIVQSTKDRYRDTYSMREYAPQAKVGDLSQTSNERLDEIAMSLIANLVRRPVEYLSRHTAPAKTPCLQFIHADTE